MHAILASCSRFSVNMLRWIRDSTLTRFAQCPHFMTNTVQSLPDTSLVRIVCAGLQCGHAKNPRITHSRFTIRDLCWTCVRTSMLIGRCNMADGPKAGLASRRLCAACVRPQLKPSQSAPPYTASKASPTPLGVRTPTSLNKKVTRSGVV